jgi:catechol 2,3-dioxygenase-like lactoylglutathione lyase family enzyme
VRGIPTARSVDHVGFTVPDLDAAVDFFTRVLGSDLLYYTSAAFDSTGGDWMTRHHGVHESATLRTAMLRCGPVSNLELLSWTYADASVRDDEPAPTAAHLAIYVADLDAATAYLTSHAGVQVLGSPTVQVNEPNEGTQFVKVQLPWGMSLELVRWPGLMPYCLSTDARLVPPSRRWNT